MAEEDIYKSACYHLLLKIKKQRLKKLYSLHISFAKSFSIFIFDAVLQVGIEIKTCLFGGFDE